VHLVDLDLAGEWRTDAMPVDQDDLIQRHVIGGECRWRYGDECQHHHDMAYPAENHQNV
jgi:hypothetical protein